MSEVVGAIQEATEYATTKPPIVATIAGASRLRPSLEDNERSVHVELLEERRGWGSIKNLERVCGTYTQREPVACASKERDETGPNRFLHVFFRICFKLLASKRLCITKATDVFHDKVRLGTPSCGGRASGDPSAANALLQAMAGESQR